MLRFSTFGAFLLLAPLTAACGGDNPTTPPTTTTPVAIVEQFKSEDVPDSTPPLNRNGGRTFTFSVQQAGLVTAKLSALGPDDTVHVGLGLGTWNGQVCQIVLRNDDAVLNVSVTGSAQTGQFCVSIYDVGKLTASTFFTIDVTHY